MIVKKSKAKKWNKIKFILVFLLDEETNIAMVYIPYILNVINN